MPLNLMFRCFVFRDVFHGIGGTNHLCGTCLVFWGIQRTESTLSLSDLAKRVRNEAYISGRKPPYGSPNFCKASEISQL